MKISFTQTYGNNRKKLLEIYSKDEELIKFKNLFDLNIYSFHNSSKEIIDYFKSINKVDNTEIIEFNGISYGQCLKRIIEKVKLLNCTHFFFSQDDTFSNNVKFLDFKELFEYIIKIDSNFMICLGHDYDELKKQNFKELNIMHNFSNYILYENSTLNYIPNKHKKFSMDDESYICTIDILEKIYNDEYFNCSDIWMAEYLLSSRFRNEYLCRHILNKSFLHNYNMIGKNIWNRHNHVNELKLRNLITN